MVQHKAKPNGAFSKFTHKVRTTHHSHFMKNWICYFSLLFIVCSCKKEQDQRKTNFPKTVDHVEEMPQRDNLWLFVMAGQSNMAGRGFVEPQDTISNKRILTIDASGQWVYAKEPLHYYEPKLTGLDCGLSFARTLLDSIPAGISVGMIPCAVGGSSIEQWLGDENFRGVQLLSNFKTQVAQAQKSGIVKGILWHQGESNAKPELIPEYGSKLKQLTDTFRSIAKNDSLPIFIGQLGSYASPIEKAKRWSSINSTISDFAKTTMHTFVINTQDLVHKEDTVHFDSESQRLMGKRFAFKYLETMKPTP